MSDKDSASQPVVDDVRIVVSSTMCASRAEFVRTIMAIAQPPITKTFVLHTILEAQKKEKP